MDEVREHSGVIKKSDQTNDFFFFLLNVKGEHTLGSGAPAQISVNQLRQLLTAKEKSQQQHNWFPIAGNCCQQPTKTLFLTTKKLIRAVTNHRWGQISSLLSNEAASMAAKMYKTAVLPRIKKKKTKTLDALEIEQRREVRGQACLTTMRVGLHIESDEGGRSGTCQTAPVGFRLDTCNCLPFFIS